MLTRTEAAAIEARFRGFRSGLEDASDLAPLPDADAVETIVRAAFWASLRREEGRMPKISLAFVPPGPWQPGFEFDRPLRLEPGALTQLAPAVESPSIHIAVWRQDDDIRVWGIVNRLPDLAFVVEVFDPGLLAIKYSRSQSFRKFGNVALLEGDMLRVVDTTSIDVPGLPAVIASLIGSDPLATLPPKGAQLMRIASNMRRHGHGGMLLVVSEEGNWLDSVTGPIPYVGSRPFSRLAGLSAVSPSGDSDPRLHAELDRAIAGIAGLTAVDGATVMNRDLEVLAFGAMVRRADSSAPVGELKLIEPVVGNVPALVDPSRLGNSRHLAAAQFANDQHDALALVASQDGQFTVVAWSEVDEVVHAYRIETLLM